MTLLLVFSISFSSQIGKEKIFPNSLTESLITPLASQPVSSKLYDFLIYLSNDKFKSCILPFISSENLLKIYFHFQNLDPNVSIEKFLPDSPGSKVEITVLDFQNSYFGYIFENEFVLLNPIIFDAKKNYRAVTLDHKNNNLIYAFFPPNKIFSFESHVLPDNQEVFTAQDFPDNYFEFLVAIASKNVQEKLQIIAYGSNTSMEYYDYFDIPKHLGCILKAYNLNHFQKFNFKVFDFYDKYNEFLLKTRWSIVVENFAKKYRYNCPWKILPAKIFFLYFGYFPIYHAQMIPFYIWSIPLQFLLFQHNFIFFWTFPCFLNFIGALFLEGGDVLFEFLHFSSIFDEFFDGIFRHPYKQAYDANRIVDSHRVRKSLQTKPPEIRWAASHFKLYQDFPSVPPGVDSNLELVFFKREVWFWLIFEMLFSRFFFTLPFLYFFMKVQGENSE